MRELTINPYGGIDWNNIQSYVGNLHQHSTESDGRESVALLIDQAKEVGADVFTVTDHDTYRIDRGVYPKVLGVSDPTHPNYDSSRPEGKFKNTFPFSAFDHDIYKDPEAKGNYTELARSGTSGEFNRNADGIMPNGLLAIQATELTIPNSNHDTVSLMCDYDGFPGNYTVEENVKNIDAAGGLSILVHPGRYWLPNVEYKPSDEFSPHWYKRIITSVKSCIAIEIHNANNRHPEDKKLWDRINNLGFKTEPVWATAGTDSHGEFHLHEKNTFFMENLTESNLKRALLSGNFYCSTGENAPIINKIEVNENEKTIALDTDGDVRWITGGIEVAKGKVLDYENTKGISKFVRAVVGTGSNTSSTNPFYFNGFVKPRNFI